MLSTFIQSNISYRFSNEMGLWPQSNFRSQQFELELLNAIDSIALLPVSETLYELLGNPPSWLHLLGHCNTSRQLVLTQSENFLENFLFDAQPFWKTHSQGSLRSGQWIQIDNQGLEHPFQAIAALIQGRPVLILQYVAEIHIQVGKILQSAREDVLKREKIEVLAYRDELTGLYNRSGFFLHAREQMAIAKANQWKVTVACVDLDRLKLINDKFGHKFGDLMIFNAASLFKKVFRQVDIVGRVGGDEFLALIVNMHGAEIHNFNARLNQIFDDWNAKQEADFKIAFSIGMANNDNATLSLEQLIEEADALMYKNKKSKIQLNVFN